jgi:hypothetical protein
MIRHLELGGISTCRQLRLFGVACCRRVWSLLTDERSRASVEVADLYAAGQAGVAELRAAHRKSAALCKTLRCVPGSPRMTCATVNAAIAADWVSVGDARFRTDHRLKRIVPGGYSAAAAAYIATSAADAAFYATYEGPDAVESVRQRRVDGIATPVDAIWEAAEVAQRDFLHDIIGNPFRPSPPLPPAVLAWNDSTVTRIAQGIYDERAFDRLPILADALLDAGCEDEELIGHCRSDGRHVRGCWAVDLILEKE